jgi:hypothetical protein
VSGAKQVMSDARAHFSESDESQVHIAKDSQLG